MSDLEAKAREIAERSAKQPVELVTAILHALREERERADMEITRLRSDNQKLREALEISLWFGPSDFFRARAALAEGNSNG